MSMGLKGREQLRAALTMLRDRAAKKVARAAVNAGLGALTKEIKSRVNGLSISGPLKAAIRATVNKRMEKKEGNDYVGKAGFGVGKKTAKKKEAAKARSARGQGGSNETRGVGISSANVHWLTGTKDRFTGEKVYMRTKDKNGKTLNHKIATGNPVHHTGAMPDVLAGIIEESVQSASPAMLAAAGNKARAVLASEAAQATKG